MKLDALYNILVKEPEPEQTNNAANAVAIEIEDRKDVIEISHRFRRSHNFYHSYLIREIFELLLGILILAWLCGFGYPIINRVINIKYFRAASSIRDILSQKEYEIPI